MENSKNAHNESATQSRVAPHGGNVGNAISEAQKAFANALKGKICTPM